jgi:hypothetical protein
MVMSTMAAFGATVLPDCCINGFCPSHKKAVDTVEYCPNHTGSSSHAECVRDMSKAPDGPIQAPIGLPFAVLIKTPVILFNAENTPIEDSYTKKLIGVAIDLVTPPPKS